MQKSIMKAIAGSALLTALLSAPLLAQSGGDAIKARSALMKEMGGAARTIGQQAQAEAPDMAAVKAAANVLTTNAAKIGGLFPAGSGPEAGVPTQAKPEIWTMPAEFKTAVENFSKAAQGLAAATDPAGFKTAAAALNPTCGGCHRTFRNTPPRGGAPGGGAPGGGAPGGAPGAAPPARAP